MFGTAGDSSDVKSIPMFRLGVACASLEISGIADDR